MASLPDFHRGDTVPYNVTFTENGVAKDISNMILFITLKANKADTDAAAAMQKKHTFPADANSIAGTGTVILTSAETNVSPGKYYYDIQLVDPTPNPVVVTTLTSGTVDVLRDISVDTA